MVSTCVILSGMTNILCLLYVGWITNYVANSPKVAESGGGEKAGRKLEEDSKGETLRIIQRLDRLESVVNEHIKGQHSARAPLFVSLESSISHADVREEHNKRFPHLCSPVLLKLQQTGRCFPPESNSCSISSFAPAAPLFISTLTERKEAAGGKHHHNMN